MAISALSPLLTPTTGTTAGSSSIASTQAAAATDPVSAALQKAQKNIDSQVDATIASLSAYGTLQSAVSDTQLASAALGKLAAGSSTADVQAAANSFIKAYNTSVSTAAGMGTTAGAASTPESRSASRIGRDLDRALTGDGAATQALSAIGVTRQPDGSLAIDASKFAAAQQAHPDQVRSALATLGQAVDQTTSAELSAGGAIGDPVAALAERSKALIAQKNAFQDAVEQLQQNAAQGSSGTGTGGAAGIAGMYGGASGFTGYGLAAYIANS